MKKVLKFIGFGFLGLFGLLILAGIFGEKKPTTSAVTAAEVPSAAVQAPPEPPKPILKTTARELAHAYEENSVAADAKFKGKRFKVDGIVTDINTDFMGDPVIYLKGGVNQFMEPSFSFDKDSAPEIAKLKKGWTITMECTGHGDIAKRPNSGDCVLPKQ
jgi:tRNA_anti-like